ncbi:MAG: arylesterase/paraoxonase [Bacteroidia bacterium]|jgi:arylesterase/paraoxonase
MSYPRIIALILFILPLAFVTNILISTGFFRTIEAQFDGVILEKVALPGAEDIMISTSDSFALISSTNRLSYPPEKEEEGGLYLIDLRSNDYTPIALTTNFEGSFAPHGISFFKKDSTYHVMAINHTAEGHSIEVFELNGKNLSPIKTLRDSSMVRPNDIVMLDEQRFYFTNDHGYTKGIGKLLEEYGGLAVSNVVYFDGENYTEVAKGIAYANGINFDAERALVYVASPRHFSVKVYAQNGDGQLSYIEDIPCGTGVDNINLDAAGNLWVGAHPNLLRFQAYAKGKKESSPSEIIQINYRSEGDYSVEKIYVEDGQEMSASTVAATFDDLIFIGNVMDDEFLILESNK